MTNNLTAIDARERWGDPNRFEDENEVERACPWCASWLRNDGKGQGVFEKVVECKNLMCPLLPTGGCYWEPWPDGWTDENKKELKMNNRRGGGAGESPLTADTTKLQAGLEAKLAMVKKLKVDRAMINGEEVHGIKSITIDGRNISAAQMVASAGEAVQGSVGDVVQEFSRCDGEPVTIRVKGTTARGMMGACFAKMSDPSLGVPYSSAVDESIDVTTWPKWTRFKQLIAIVFHPWRVWELHDQVTVKDEQIEDLIGDLERVSGQRDEINRMARRQMLRNPAGGPGGFL